jgi:hypothetical protein
MGGCFAEKTLLGIPCEIPFNTEIQHFAVVKTQGDISIKHADVTMGFNNTDV